MNREEILAKAQSENGGRDVADVEAQQKGAFAAYYVGIFLILAVELIEWLARDRFSCGAIGAIFAMGCAAFIVKYRVRRKRHELVVAICHGSMAALWLVMWILQLCGVTG